MLRKILTVVLPLAAPFIVWWLYMVLARWRARRAQEPDPPGWTQAPWTAILLTAVVLLATSLLWFHSGSGGAAWTEYTAPSFEDGQIVPSRLE